MPSVLHPLLLIFARVTHHELARMVQYLKVENAILRSKLPKVVQVTPRERTRLVKYGKAVGDKIKELVQIVTPRTFARWVNGETGRKEPAKKGRPRTAEYIRELILKIARETGYGYTSAHP